MNTFQRQSTKKPKTYSGANILESLRDISRGVGDSVISDLPKGIAADALNSLFGTSTPRSGELKPNEQLEMSGEQSKPASYVPESAQARPIPKQESGLKEKIDAVRLELKALAASIQSLNKEIEKAVSETPVDPGVYHANFFERLRSLLKLLREQVEDSRTWLSMFTGRKKKAGYWGMYKKHGTTFGLSHERNVATQSG